MRIEEVLKESGDKRVKMIIKQRDVRCTLSNNKCVFWNAWPIDTMRWFKHVREPCVIKK